MNTCPAQVRRRKRFAAGKTLAQGQFTCPEHVKSMGPPRGLTRGEFITCCEEEKTERLTGGAVFHIQDGKLV